MRYDLNRKYVAMCLSTAEIVPFPKPFPQGLLYQNVKMFLTKWECVYIDENKESVHFVGPGQVYLTRLRVPRHQLEIVEAPLDSV